MFDAERGEPEGYDSVNGRELEQTHGEQVLEDPLGRVGKKRDADHLCVVPLLAEPGGQGLRRLVGRVTDEWCLRLHDADVHESSLATTFSQLMPRSRSVLPPASPSA